MKYINKFSTNADYQAFTEGGGYVTPNICYVEESDGIVMNPYIESALITFTVNGVEYQAEEGMNWEEFINSDYNPTIFAFDTEMKEFSSLSNYVAKNSTSGTVVHIVLNGVKVVLNEQIFEQEYSTQKIY